MNRRVFALFLLSLFIISFQVSAQSGSMPPDPDPGAGGQSSGGSAPADPIPVPPAIPVEEEPVMEVSSEPSPVVAPKPKVTKPKATPKPEPVVQSLGTAEVVVEEAMPVVPEEDNFVLQIVGGVAALLGLGFLGFQVKKNNKKKEEKKNDPCGEIKSKRDAKKTELVGTIGEVSLQEALVEKLKEKIENKIKDEAKDKAIEKGKDIVLGALGNNTLNNAVKVAHKGKKTYDNISEKYEKAKEILEVLRQKKEGLTGELEQLESACKKCMMEVGTEALVSQGIRLDILDTIEQGSKWYKVYSIPCERVWLEDPNYPQELLAGEKVNASFVFNKDGTEILEMKVEQI